MSPARTDETVGHGGRKDDPLYRCRRLLTKADERLDDKGRTKPLGLLDAGDPNGEVRTAWHAKKLSDRYMNTGIPNSRSSSSNGSATIQDESCPPEIRQLGRTLLRWRDQIAAWHQAHVSNGPTEAANNLINASSPPRSASRASGTTESARCSMPASQTGTYSPPSNPAEIRSARLMSSRIRSTSRSSASMRWSISPEFEA